jgi:hypothetical protein
MVAMSFDSTFPAPPPRAAAGWYRDPHDIGGQRYWDGAAWTEHRAGPDAGSALQPTLVLPPAEPPAYSPGVVATYSAPVAPVYGPVVAHPGYAALPVRRPSAAHVAFAWICAVVSFLYFLPWAIAATRGRPNTGGVFVVNLLVGWTLIGWIIALVMACQ